MARKAAALLLLVMLGFSYRVDAQAPSTLIAIAQAEADEKAAHFDQATALLASSLASNPSAADVTALTDAASDAYFLWGNALGNAGKLADALGKFQQALSCAARTGNRKSTLPIVANIGLVDEMMGDHRKALSADTQALALAVEADNVPMQEREHRNAGIVYTSLHEYPNALLEDQKALSIAARIGDMGIEETDLRNLGIDESNLRHYRAAADHYDQALKLATKIGNSSEQELDFRGEGSAETNLHENQKALSLDLQALALAVKLDDPGLQNIDLVNAGIDYENVGQYDKAIDPITKAVAIATKAADTVTEERNLSCLGAVYQHLGQYADALASYTQILALTTKDGNARGQGYALRLMGIDYTDLGRNDKALAADEQALEIAEKSQLAADEETDWADLGYDYRNLGRYAEALSADRECASTAVSAGVTNAEAIRIHRSLAADYDNLDRYQDALTENHVALAIADRTGDWQAEEQVRADIGSVFESLSQYPTALAWHQQALKIADHHGDKASEVSALSAIEFDYAFLDEIPLADQAARRAVAIAQSSDDNDTRAAASLDQYSSDIRATHYGSALQDAQQALIDYQKSGNIAGQANATEDMATSEMQLSGYDQAAPLYAQALALLDKEASQVAASPERFEILCDWGGDCTFVSRYSEAMSHYQDAEKLMKTSPYTFSPILALRLWNGYGCNYDDLGQTAKALDCLNRALSLAKQAKDSSDEAIELCDIAWCYDGAGRSAIAVGYYQRALRIQRAIGDRRGVAFSAADLGVCYQRLNRPRQAIAQYDASLPLIREVRERLLEGRIVEWEGWAYSCLGKIDQAAPAMAAGLTINREVHDTAGEGLTLSHLMSAYKRAGQPRAAIFYGKQAVNTYQQIRQQIHGLGATSDRAFVESNEPTYRTLADLLISQGRLPEAEQVLALLKRQELSDVLRGPVTVAGIPGLVDLTPTEAAQEAQYEAIADQVTSLGSERQSLLDKEKLGALLTAPDQQELDSVTTRLDLANRHLRLFLSQLSSIFSAQTPEDEGLQERLQSVKNAAGLQDTLRRLHSQGQDVVVLETVVAPDRYAAIVTTANSRKVDQYAITSGELAKKVAALQDALRDPTLDPTGPANALYKIVVAPIEADLAQAHTAGSTKPLVLMWSLDGCLRYIPIAALYDGKQYLVQRFDNEVFTLGSQSGFGDDERSQWNALGLGVTQAETVSDPSTGLPIQFPALSGVAPELHGVVRDADHPNGAMPGALLLDGQFSQTAVTQALETQQYNVVHIASHFALLPSDPDSSFLLLGRGPWTLKDMADDSTLFSGVDLVALSACETATGAKEGDGREVDSLGSVAQQDGAKSVLASLWPVADQSTRILMQTFYRWHQDHPADSKAEALRQAQLALIAGAGQTLQSGTRGTVAVGSASTAPRYVPNPAKPYAHPYYWAPFVLIGNWK